jgi:hypothetical protein
MRLPDYVYKKLTIIERIKYLLYRRKVNSMTDKMDYHLKKSCEYETLMYNSDGRFNDFIKEMSVKYA